MPAPQIDTYDYTAAAERGTRAERWFHAARLRLFRDIVDVRNRDVLDVGAGTGLLALDAAARGGRVAAVDAHPPHLVALGERARARGLSVQTVAADAAALPFPDDTFDIVVLMSVVHLAEAPGPLLREAERVCRTNGRVIVGGPWRYHPKSSRLLKTLLRGGRAPETTTFRFDGPALERHLLRSVRIDRKLDIAAGYAVYSFNPSRKP